MSDYAEPLLKIKAAVKRAESDLPAKRWDAAIALAGEIEFQARQLRNVAIECEESHRKAA